MKRRKYKEDALYRVAMVSLYPKRGELYSKGTTGVASYAKNTVTKMKGHVLVLADYDRNRSSYTEQNTHVIRCFKTNTMKMWTDLYETIRLYPNLKDVIIQFDTSMYGNILVSGMIVFFLAFLKRAGIRTYVVNHHVVSDVRKLSGHIGLGHGIYANIQAIVYNTLFHVFYRMLGFAAHKIVVLEESLNIRMKKYTNPNNIVTIPHAVDTELSPITKKLSRKKLHLSESDYVILFFGFVNWFKGADFLVSAFSHVKKLGGRRVKVIIAGGESATLKDKEYYKKYFKSVVKKIDHTKHIKITGYVPQKKIASYFSACDLVIFPYRECMCASGVLSLAFSYKRPFIVSSAFGEMFETDGIADAAKKAKLKISDITFALQKKDLLKKAEKVLQNGAKKKMRAMAQTLRENRSFEENVKIYEQMIEREKIVDQIEG